LRVNINYITNMGKINKALNRSNFKNVAGAGRSFGQSSF
jgi:hypothetical protein